MYNSDGVEISSQHKLPIGGSFDLGLPYLAIRAREESRSDRRLSRQAGESMPFMTKIQAISSALSHMLRLHLSAIRRGLALLVAAFLVLFLLSVLDHAVGYLVSRKPQGLVFPPHSTFRYETPEFTYTVETNSLGFRDREVAEKKDCESSPSGIRLPMGGESKSINRGQNYLKRRWGLKC